jgi:hypothetical protein
MQKDVKISLIIMPGLLSGNLLWPGRSWSANNERMMLL